MENETLTELISYKDKSKASQAKRAVFSNEWLGYVSGNGFDETAERYLFAGFEYRKMHPFVDYLKTVENREKIVLRFLNGKQFQKNMPKSFKMSLNLLAILFTELPEEQLAMVHVIRRLPAVSIGKDKKRMPEAGKVFEKFFFAEFTEATVLPNLEMMVGLKPVSITDFRALVNDATLMVSKSGEIDEKIKNAYERTVNWNKELTATEFKESPAHEDVGGISDVASEKVDSGKNDIRQQKTADVEDETPIVSWKSSLKYVSTTIECLETQTIVFKEKLAIRESEIADLRETISKKDVLLSKANEDANSLRAREIQMGKEIDELTEKIDLLNKTVQEKEREIADRSKLAEMLSRDTNKQSDAVLKRLSSELSSYYEDFMAAECEIVTEEIGNILRDQMGEIFAILKKNGIRLQ